MKDVIGKAIENGFDVEKLLPTRIGSDITFYKEWGCNEEHDGLVIYYKSGGHVYSYMTSLYRVVFGTDFVDSIISKPTKCCCNCLFNGGIRKRRYRWVWCSLGFFGKEVRYKKCCDSFEIAEPDNYSSNYHRREMANMMDIEKLKEYVRGLI